MVAGAVTTLAEAVPNQPDGGPMMMVVGTGLIAFVISVIFWPVFAFIVAIPHEGGHALVGSAMGAKIHSIGLDRRANGETVRDSVGPFGNFFASLAGYVAPSIFGIAGAALLAKHHVGAVLWTSVAMLVLTLLQARGWFTVVFTIVLGAVFYGVARYATAGEQAFFAYIWVWCLLLGGFRHVIHLQILRRDNSDVGDVGNLRKMTHLPGSFFGAFFWLASLVALIYGACLLLGYMHIETLWALIKSQLV